MKIKTNLFKKCFGKSKFLEVYGRMEVLDMATSSLYARIVLDEEACQKLIQIMENPNKPKIPEFDPENNSFERGRKLLERYPFHCTT